MTITKHHPATSVYCAEVRATVLIEHSVRYLSEDPTRYGMGPYRAVSGALISRNDGKDREAVWIPASILEEVIAVLREVPK